MIVNSNLIRHKTFHSYVGHHTLSAYMSFHAILSDNLKMYYFRDNYNYITDFRATSADPWSTSFMVETRTVSDRLRAPTFVLDQ